MEQGLNRAGHCSRGFVLPLVLFITAVGLLFGAGSLLLFRYQCQLRIDQQHELEKVNAVRSALNWIKKNAILINADVGNVFRYHTESGRDLKIVVKPVVPFFPNTVHTVDESGRPIPPPFVMERGDLFIPSDVASRTNGYYNSDLDYECGSFGATNLLICTKKYMKNEEESSQLSFGDATVTNGVRLWVNIGMRNRGGWVENEYGRRYYFLPQYYVGNSQKDIVRLCLIRNVMNERKGVGYKHGWPLSMTGEKALVLESRMKGDGSNADISLWEYEYGKQPVAITNYVLSATYKVGLQIAGKNVSIFSIDQGKVTVPGRDISASYGFVFKPETDEDPLYISDSLYNYFGGKIELGDDNNKTIYDGVTTNKVNGAIYAPDMRAVFEIVVDSDSRSGDGSNKLTEFKVEPAYRFDVFLEYPVGVTNRATVAQVVGKYLSNYNDKRTVVTYDTHGTENKGFRKDEREAERRRQGQGQ